jgi:hypothetical protein
MSAVPPSGRPQWRRVIAPVIAALVTAAIVGAGVRFVMRPVGPRVTRLTVALLSIRNPSPELVRLLDDLCQQAVMFLSTFVDVTCLSQSRAE